MSSSSKNGPAVSSWWTSARLSSGFRISTVTGSCVLYPYTIISEPRSWYEPSIQMATPPASAASITYGGGSGWAWAGQATPKAAPASSAANTCTLTRMDGPQHGINDVPAPPENGDGTGRDSEIT